MNDFIRKYFEYGFYDKHLEWNLRLSDAMFENFRDRSPNEIQIALTMEIAYEVFLLYFFGIFISCIVFIVEITFWVLSRIFWNTEIKK